MLSQGFCNNGNNDNCHPSSDFSFVTLNFSQHLNNNNDNDNDINDNDNQARTR